MYRMRKKITSSLLTLLTILLVLGSITPLLWLISTSLKNKLEAFAIPPKMLFTPTFENYVSVFQTGGFLPSYLNSLIIAVLTTALTLVFGVTSGYALARMKSRAGSAMGMWIILARMIPPIGIIIPFYMMFRQVGFNDQYLSVCLVYMTITLPFATWLMMGFIRDVPDEIEEAALIDGCTRTQSLIRIIIPVVKPGLGTCAIFSFIQSWNEFLYALIITGKQTRTVSVAIQGFVSSTGTSWGSLCAASMLVILPILIFSIFTQRSLVRGLTSGAVKM